MVAVLFTPMTLAKAARPTTIITPIMAVAATTTTPIPATAATTVVTTAAVAMREEEIAGAIAGAIAGVVMAAAAIESRSFSFNLRCSYALQAL